MLCPNNVYGRSRYGLRRSASASTSIGAAVIDDSARRFSRPGSCTGQNSTRPAASAFHVE